MSISTLFKKAKSQHIFILVIVLFVVLYFIYKFYKHLDSKGKSGSESYGSSMPSQYSGQASNKQPTNSQNVSAYNPELLAPSSGMNGVNELNPAPVQPGTQTSMPGLPTSCSKPNIQNPAELLPKDVNSQWAQLNPQGKGEVANINHLRAGYLIGVDSIGGSLRNPNLQIRSEPPNPQLNVGPWNQSTITPDFQRPALEIGSGSL
jgi:hypothetical protein